MQYGNFKPGTQSPQAIMFKSYYVVWKPSMKCISMLSKFKFKSYYVVWKPEHSRKIYYKFVQFKSYYVVWKHRYKERPAFHCERV